MYLKIFIEQILDTLASKYIIYTDSSKIEEDVNKSFKNYVQPIIEVINDENYCIDRIKEEFWRKVKRYIRSFEARYNRYIAKYNDEDIQFNDLIGINSKKDEMLQPLDSIKESLDNLKDFAYLMTIYRSDVNTHYIIQLFKSKLHKKLMIKYNDIAVVNTGKIKYEEAKEIMRFIKDENKDIPFARIERLNNQYIKSENFKYRISCFEQLTFIYFEFMLKFNKKMSLCHNCRKVFIAERSNVKYCQECKRNGSKKVYEKNNMVRKIKKRFDNKIDYEKKLAQNDKEKQFNIKKLREYSERFEIEAKKNKDFNKSTFVNRLKYLYDYFIAEYNRDKKKYHKKNTL